MNPPPLSMSILWVFASFTATALAQSTSPIDTDRPDQTESSTLVGRGLVQIELGLSYTDEGEGTESVESPTTLVRIGVIDRLELRFGIPTVVTQFDDGATTDLADPDLGMKLKLWTEKGWRPEAALVAGTTVPVGSGHVSSDRFDPAFRFAFSHTLLRRLSLGYNAGVAWATTEHDTGGRTTVARFEYTAALGYDITDRWGAFIEVFGDTGLSDNVDAAHSLDGGLTFLLRENVQFDVAAGAGVTDEAPDWFVTAGISVRIPR